MPLSWTSRLPVPSTTIQRALGIAAVVTQGGIAVTGSVVRVTGSGLGCPTWPECFPGSLTPAAHSEVATLHTWVEFGNRLLGVSVGVVGGLCLIAALLAAPRRPRQLWLAGSMVLGIVAQAVIGGFTVLTGLRWWSVAPHFLASMVLVWLAVLLVRAAAEGDGPPRPVIPPTLLRLQVAQATVLATLLVAGTLVTSAGPHAGDQKTPRLNVPVATLAQAHADVLFLFLGMLVALGFALRVSTAPAQTWRAYWILVGVVFVQGVLGMVQYWTGVPEVLVSLHVLGAAMVITATAALWCTSRDRDHLSTVAPPVPASTDSTSQTNSAEAAIRT